MKVGGDTLEDAVALVRHFLFEIDRGGRSCVTGGYSQGGVLTVIERPDVTHDTFCDALERHLEKP